MIRLDHLTIGVSDYAASRDWYVDNFGLRVEFENQNVGFGGLEDDGAVELILVQQEMAARQRDCTLTFQCDSVHAKFQELADRGNTFVHEPSMFPGAMALSCWIRMGIAFFFGIRRPSLATKRNKCGPTSACADGGRRHHEPPRLKRTLGGLAPTRLNEHRSMNRVLVVTGGSRGIGAATALLVGSAWLLGVRQLPAEPAASSTA
jgi:catechol 2,3-dioxygenase-like lactoylglutathione lyase family enzyme